MKIPFLIALGIFCVSSSAIAKSLTVINNTSENVYYYISYLAGTCNKGTLEPSKSFTYIPEGWCKNFLLKVQARSAQNRETCSTERSEFEKMTVTIKSGNNLSCEITECENGTDYQNRQFGLKQLPCKYSK